MAKKTEDKGMSPTPGDFFLTFSSDYKLLDFEIRFDTNGSLEKFLREKVDSVSGLDQIPPNMIVAYNFDDVDKLPNKQDLMTQREYYELLLRPLVEVENFTEIGSRDLVEAAYCIENNIGFDEFKATQIGLSFSPQYRFYKNVNEHSLRNIFSNIDFRSESELVKQLNETSGENTYTWLPSIGAKGTEVPELHIMLSPDKKVTNLTISEHGKYGFKRFVEQNCQNDEYPIESNDCIISYRFEDKSMIPEAELGNFSDYMDKLLPVLEEHNIKPIRQITLFDAMYCDRQGYDYIDEQHSHEYISKEPLYHSYLYGLHRLCTSENKDFHTHYAVENDKGVLLFSDTERGNELKKAYLQYHVNNYFSSNYDKTFLKIHKVALMNDANISKVDFDCGFNVDNESNDTKPIPSEAYASASALDYARCSRSYELYPDCYSLDQLSHWEIGEDLALPNEVRDIDILDYISKEGLDESWYQELDWQYEFTHSGQFKEYAERLEKSVNNYEERAKIKDVCKAKAQFILNRDYVDRRTDNVVAKKDLVKKKGRTSKVKR